MSESLFKHSLLPYMLYMSPYMDVFEEHVGRAVKREKERAPIKKCHRPGCENIRFDNKLYCSKECCELDKPRIKSLK